ncbi:hypothetical protein AXG93_2817s1000 [Marchantia polymorpha subsp. ruderalis]|uniref:Uncharacterized protein n=1 Tax=Marchantia polymorpha subsp. ruderalis TaxID=1480154 RepID=A0A176W2L0_MARPO|nr:hypothetical protein AXG93_2817s1000 [Marchantia polymorpha subsp. ruderalis]
MSKAVGDPVFDKLAPPAQSVATKAAAPKAAPPKAHVSPPSLRHLSPRIGLPPKATHPKSLGPKALELKAHHPAALSPKALYSQALGPKALEPKALYPQAPSHFSAAQKALEPKAPDPRSIQRTVLARSTYPPPARLSVPRVVSPSPKAVLLPPKASVPSAQGGPLTSLQSARSYPPPSMARVSSSLVSTSTSFTYRPGLLRDSNGNCTHSVAVRQPIDR